jgi:hypothetical protein
MQSFCGVEFFEGNAGDAAEDGLPVAGYLGDAGQPVLRLRYDSVARGRRPGRLERRPADARMAVDTDPGMGPALFLIHLWDAFEPQPEGSGGASFGAAGVGEDDPAPVEGPVEAVDLWVTEDPELALPPWPGPEASVERLRLEFGESGAAGSCGLAIWRGEGVAAIIAGEAGALRRAVHTFHRLLAWRPA